MSEEKEVKGYKATGVWEEKGFARTRKKPGIIEESNKEKAREIAEEYMEEYAAGQDKKLDKLTIELYPVHE